MPSTVAQKDALAQATAPSCWAPGTVTGADQADPSQEATWSLPWASAMQNEVLGQVSDTAAGDVVGVPAPVAAGPVHDVPSYR